MRVRTHLTIMAVLIVAPFLVVAATALAILLRAEQDGARHQVREIAQAVTLAVDRELAVAETSLRVLATSPHLENGDLAAFHRQALVARTSASAWVILFDRDGQQLVNTRFPASTALPRRVNPERVAEVIRTQKPSVSDVYVGAMTRLPIVTVDVPVPLDGGRRYVLTHSFFPNYFDLAFAERELPRGWVVRILDGKGRLISRSRPSGEAPADPPQDVSTLAARGGEVLHKNADGQEVFEVFRPSARSDWTVAVAVPTAVLEGAATQAVWVAGFGLLGAVLLASLLAAALGRNLAGAISSTADSALALGKARLGKWDSSNILEVEQLRAALGKAQAERDRLLESERQARELAEERNNAKDSFLAILAHELRNPLAAINGGAALIDAVPDLPETARHARDVIVRQSFHLNRIVDDLLDIRRLETGRVHLDLGRIDLGEAVRRCVATLEASGRARQHRLRVEASTAWIDADITRLDQIVNNLVVNALKYTPEGGRIDVEVRAEGDEAVLSVADTGIGIPGDLLPRVFDAFVQGPASMDRAQGGLGIGLSVVRHLVAMHGGTIRVHSGGPGRGSTFTACFPLREAPAEPAASPLLSPVLNRRVLLVDDHEDGRSTLRMLLEMHGCSVIEAGSGSEAIRLASQRQVDLAIVDIGLPDIDGHEVARRLGADPGTKDIPLVALTGFENGHRAQRAADSGFREHLVKPVEARRLLNAIKAATSARVA